MKIVIPGGSGFLGELLTRSFLSNSHEVLILGRKKPLYLLSKARYMKWDAVHLGDWKKEIDGADVVINLAGMSIQCFFNQKNLEELRNSRILSTQVLGQAIEQSQKPPPLWLQLSSVGIYSHRLDAPNDEARGKIGSEPYPIWEKISQLIQDWEKTLWSSNTSRTRKVAVRCAMVMDIHKRSAFRVFLKLCKWGLGGSVGGGKQMLSWIHGEDFVRAMEFLMDKASISGPVNLSSPHPVSQKEFMQTMREVLGIKIGFPAPRWMVVLSSYITRIDSELILKSRYAFPKVLRDHQFTFRFPHCKKAMENLYSSLKKKEKK